MKTTLLLLAVCAALPGQTIFQLSTGARFDSGEGPQGAVVADLNGDGVGDLAFADYKSGKVQVLLGDGRGGYVTAPGSPFSMGTQPTHIVAGDFNGDGKLDLAVLNALSIPPDYSSSKYAVYLGDGTGAFHAGIFGLTLGRGVTFAVADFNRDGRADLVLVTDKGVFVMLSNNVGGFDPGAEFPRIDAQGVATGDFNRDGFVDFTVSSGFSASVTSYLNDGMGAFRRGMETVLPSNSFPVFVTVGDWNEDGILDLATTTSVGDGITILLGDGRGAFRIHAVLPYAVAATVAPSVADFDGDGHLDLVTLNFNESIVLLGDGFGNFHEGQRLPLASYSGFALAVDSDADGKPDVLLSNGQTWRNVLKTLPVSPATIQLNASANQTALRSVPLAIGITARVQATSDAAWLRFDGTNLVADALALRAGSYDGTVHFAAPGYFGSAVRVHLNVAAPSGRLAPASSMSSSYLNRVGYADLNRDGKPDLIGKDEGVLTVRLNDGNGNFSESVSTTALLEPGSIALADFTGDGVPDAVVLGRSGIAIYEGDGVGGFRAGRLTGIRDDFSLDQIALAADFNNDGLADIAVVAQVPDLPFRIFLADGHGGFRARSRLANLRQRMPIFSVAADFNGDGFMDIAYAEIAGENVYVLFGNGKGGFRLGQTLDFGIGSTPGGLTVGDFNGDGHPDLAVVNHGFMYESLVTVLLNNGAGGLTSRTNYRFDAPRVTGPIATADVNGDGRLDLLVGLYGDGVGSTALLFGDGAGAFVRGTNNRLNGYVLYTGDLDGDGRTDAITYTSTTMDVLLGAAADASVRLTKDADNPFTYGQTVGLTVTVATPVEALETAAGTVTLFDGSLAVGTADLLNGTAHFLVKFVPGSHGFRAVYNGNARFNTGESTLTVVEAGAPVAIQALSNALPLRAQVTDANGNAVSGVGVIFTAPIYGPSGLFGTSNAATAITDANGIATAPALTPNGYAGHFSITATISGYPGPSATFFLQN